MRRHLSYANVAATLALVMSTSGAAIAAQHYLITSTSQISPKVLHALRGHDGRDGARGATGPAGERGPQGVHGPQGYGGPIGPTGPTGPAGSGAGGAGGGATGATGPTGEAGEPRTATVVEKTMKAESGVDGEPKSIQIFKLGEVPVHMFCGFVPFAGNTIGGLAARGPEGSQSNAGVIESDSEGKPAESAVSLDLARSVALPSTEDEYETVAEIITNNVEPKGNEGFVNATITEPGGVIYVSAFLEVSPTEPDCTLRASAYRVPR